jgi:hypothetical protein
VEELHSAGISNQDTRMANGQRFTVDHHLQAHGEGRRLIGCGYIATKTA